MQQIDFSFNNFLLFLLFGQFEGTTCDLSAKLIKLMF